MEDNPDYPIHVMFFEDMKEVTIVKRYVLLVLSVETNSWFDYVLDWERVMEDNPDYPIHVMFFEDMKEVHASCLSTIINEPRHVIFNNVVF